MARFTPVLEVLAHRGIGLELAVALPLAVALSTAAVLLLSRLGTSAPRLIVARLAPLLPASLLLLGLLPVRLEALALSSLSTALALLAALPTSALLARPAGLLLAAALLAAAVLLAAAAFVSLRSAGLAPVLEVCFGTRVCREAALVAVLTLALASSLTAALGLHSGAALALILALLVPLAAAGAVALIRLRARPSTRARLAG